MQPQTTSPILVTGASGYLASHLIKLLLERGYKVRGSIRSLAQTEKYKFLYDLVPNKEHNLEFVEADLNDKSSWLAAVQGCEYVFHVASPFPTSPPKDEMEIITPAVNGVNNVLEASLEKGVKKVVVTSSGLAIFMGRNMEVTEDDWLDESKCPAYVKSKLLAEKAAWKFYEKNKSKIEMSVVNSLIMFGPEYTKHGGASETQVADIMNGIYPGAINVTLPIVDVRDAAEAHFKTMFNENTNGERYICSAREVHFGEMIDILKNEFEKYGYPINNSRITADEAKASGNAVIQKYIGMIGKDIRVNNQKSLKELGMTYRPVKETFIDMGYSLIDNGVVPDKISSADKEKDGKSSNRLNIKGLFKGLKNRRFFHPFKKLNPAK